MKCYKLIFVLFAIALNIIAISCQEESVIDSEEDYMFQKFQRFMEKYQKQYENIEEFTKRYNIFKTNYQSVKNHTIEDQDEAGDEKMREGTTPFSDLTPEEFQQQFLTTVDDSVLPSDAETFKLDEGNSTDASNPDFLNQGQGRVLQAVPSSWDWRQKGAVTNVKQQGSCGGCWAFSAAANIEGLYARKYGKLVSFSNQQQIDCDSSNNGCNGGIMHNAFNYIRRTGGLMTEASYPFRGSRGMCRFNPSQAVAKVRSYVNAGTTNEESIKAMLYRTGPLSITMNARTLQFYKGGVYNVPYNSCPYAPNHGVTLVGYGTTSSGLDYWIIKNSWGARWGESGYFRIARGRGLCGVNRYVYSAVLA